MTVAFFYQNRVDSSQCFCKLGIFCYIESTDVNDGEQSTAIVVLQNDITAITGKTTAVFNCRKHIGFVINYADLCVLVLRGSGVTGKIVCFPSRSHILQTDYARSLRCFPDGQRNMLIAIGSITSTCGIAQYSNRVACAYGVSPLCIKRQVFAKGVSCKGLCAIAVGIPTSKAAICLCGGGKVRKFLACKTGNCGKNFNVVVAISVFEGDCDDRPTANITNICIVELMSQGFTLSCVITYGASLGSGAGCCYPSVSERIDYASLNSGFKSTLFVGVNVVANRTSVIFLVTCSSAGCRSCFFLYKLVGTIYSGSVFVALAVANCTFLVLDTVVIIGRLSIDYPFIVVNSFTGGTATVITLCVTSVCPSVADCKGCAIVGIITYAAGMQNVTILFTGSVDHYHGSFTVSEGRNPAILYSHFNSTVCIGENLIAFRAGVMFLVARSRAGCFACCLCEGVRTSTRGNSYVDKNRIAGILFAQNLVAFNHILHVVRNKYVIALVGIVCSCNGLCNVGIRSINKQGILGQTLVNVAIGKLNGAVLIVVTKATSDDHRHKTVAFVLPNTVDLV